MTKHHESGMGDICRMKANALDNAEGETVVTLVYDDKRGHRNYTVKSESGKAFVSVTQTAGSRIGKCFCKEGKAQIRCSHIDAVATEDKHRFPEAKPVPAAIILSFPKKHMTEEKPADINQTAANQALAVALLFADETNGGAIWRAFEKAEREIARNKTIRFANGVLVFTSRGSGLVYRITAAGCSVNCKAFVAETFCYHRAMFAIFECRAGLLSGEEIVYAEAQKKAA